MPRSVNSAPAIPHSRYEIVLPVAALEIIDDGGETMGSEQWRILNFEIRDGRRRRRGDIGSRRCRRRVYEVWGGVCQTPAGSVERVVLTPQKKKKVLYGNNAFL